ncbi:MAG: NUDIX hydrolase [Anaerolineales bacterium]|nr:NUDIX hydrolase [Anaerolineales bacterium]
MPKPPKILSSENRFSGRAFGVRVDQIRLADGRETALEIVEHAGSVAIVPLAEGGGIWFVRQYRHAAGRDLLELPAGTLNPGEAPEACAGRELREEIGMRAGRLTALGGFFLAPGYATEYMCVFLAEGLDADPLPADADEELFPELLTKSNVHELLETGAIEDGKTIAALAIAFRRFRG